jgi:two-component system response regulator PilR (NtrC family)
MRSQGIDAPHSRARRAGVALPSMETTLALSHGPRIRTARPEPRGVSSGGDALVRAPGSPLEETLRLAEAAAPRNCPVFLRGESGTGKELLARFLHQRGSRPRGPFVAVNCAAIPPHLIESELFGHRKGAFTGAVEDHPGKFRMAEGGTLFLDEIGDMPQDVQTRLLRVLQEKTVCPVGDRREYAVDFRLVCATHRDLGEAVAAGRFREDLFYRLNVMEIRLPPLRERPMDVPFLARHFLCAALGAEAAGAALSSAPADLAELPFPGNVRELRNLVERYCVLRELGKGWEEAMLPCRVTSRLPREGVEGPRAAEPAAGSRVRNSRVTDGDIMRALGECGYHRSRASRLLGITRRALQYRLAKMGPGSVREEASMRK